MLLRVASPRPPKRPFFSLERGMDYRERRMIGFPSPLDDDPEDVSWGLTTGGALWKRGERHDAIVWLKRAVDAALAAGQGTRADGLNHAATDLIAALAARAADGRVGDSASIRAAPPQRPAAKPG